MDIRTENFKAQHTHSYILPLQKKPSSLHFYFSLLHPFFWAVWAFSPNPQVYFSPASASLFLFLPDIWLDSQPHTETNVMTSLRCNVPQAERARQREKKRERWRGDKRNNTKEECWGGMTKKNCKDRVEVLAEGENSGRQDLYSRP